MLKLVKCLNVQCVYLKNKYYLNILCKINSNTWIQVIINDCTLLKN